MRKTCTVLTFACAMLMSSVAESKPKEDDFLCGLIGSCMTPAELQQAIAAAQAFPLGSDKNPVRSDMPPGERAYLQRLQCSDGSAPAFERGGSVGEGPYDTIMDVYELRCLSGQPATASVYMDMYHKGYTEDRAVPGFTISPK